jgi:hypothetical protein
MPALQTRHKAKPAVPALLRHVRGGYFVRIPKALGGDSKWFSSEPDTARAA